MDLEIDRHNWRSGVILQLSESSFHHSGWVVTVLVSHLFKVSDSPRVIQRSVIWEANVEKAGVFLRHELMHVVL